MHFCLYQFAGHFACTVCMYLCALFVCSLFIYLFFIFNDNKLCNALLFAHRETHVFLLVFLLLLLLPKQQQQQYLMKVNIFLFFHSIVYCFRRSFERANCFCQCLSMCKSWHRYIELYKLNAIWSEANKTLEMRTFANIFFPTLVSSLSPIFPVTQSFLLLFASKLNYMIYRDNTQQQCEIYEASTLAYHLQRRTEIPTNKSFCIHKCVYNCFRKWC